MWNSVWRDVGLVSRSPKQDLAQKSWCSLPHSDEISTSTVSPLNSSAPFLINPNQIHIHPLIVEVLLWQDHISNTTNSWRRSDKQTKFEKKNWPSHSCEIFFEISSPLEPTIFYKERCKIWSWALFTTFALLTLHLPLTLALLTLFKQLWSNKAILSIYLC